MPLGTGWRKGGDAVKQRRRTNAIRDVKDFSGVGRYTPIPGQGPYPWKRAGRPSFANDISLGGTESEGWYRCPATSHLEAIRFVRSLDEGGEDELQIMFIDGGGASYFAGPGRTQRLETIYEMMKEAEHPGQLVWSALILEEFPYTSTS